MEERSGFSPAWLPRACPDLPRTDVGEGNVMFLACPALWRTVLDEGDSEFLAMTTMQRQTLEEGDTLLPVWQVLGRSVVVEGVQASHSRGGAVSMAWHPRAYLVLGRPAMELGG